MRYCVVIRGPLGVGKTTVSRQLALEVGAECISIDQILEEHGLEEWDADRIALRSFLAANRIAVARASSALARETPVVIEGNFYWNEQLDDLVRNIDGRTLIFTLRAPLEVCIARDAMRPEPREGAGPRAGDHLGKDATREVYALAARVDRGVPVDATGTIQGTVHLIRAHLPIDRRQSRAGPPSRARGTARAPSGKR